MANKMSALSLQNKVLKRNRLKFIPYFTWRRIKINKKMNFYTGITTVAGFHAIFSLIEPKVKYWRGTKRSIVSTKFAVYNK